jgi:hypothetical protein
MSSFLPVDANKVNTLISEKVGQVSPVLATAVGQRKTAQLGNNPITRALQDLATPVIGRQAAGLVFAQQSAFPDRKFVSFSLLNRNGAYLEPPPPNLEGYKPGLTFDMWVNPSNLNITLPPKSVNATRTLGGWKLQHWYPELGSIRGDGIIGNMLERYNRDLKDSTAWRNFVKLLNVYQMNGAQYVNAVAANQNRFTVQNQFLPIAMLTFDKITYYGYFESFEYTESEETPHTLKYSFSMKYTSFKDTRDMAIVTRVPGTTLPQSPNTLPAS